MRIVQLMGTSGGGVVRHVASAARGLVAAGERVAVVGPDLTLRAWASADPPVGVRTRPLDVGDRPRPGDVGTVVRLRGLIAEADVVHAHGVRAGALAVLAARSLRARPAVVVTVHNGPPASHAAGSAFRLLERLVARGADDVLVVSGDLGERLVRAGARRVRRALVPAPTRQTIGADACARERGLVVTVARLAPQKAPDLLLDVVARLTAEGHDRLHVVVAGEGPMRSHLQARVTAEHLPVDLPGAVDGVAELFARADAVVLTSRWEGQPLVLQEALRAGAAIVATDVGGVREVCGEAAVLVPWPPRRPGPVAELADAVAGILDDPSRAAALRLAAAARAAELPTEADMLAQLLDAYAEAFARIRRG